MKYSIETAVVIFSFVSLISCNNNNIDPEQLPGRRDYVWTADTIKIPFKYLYKIWGDSPHNVWAVGPGGASSTAIWKYDGNKWTSDNISRNIAPYGIWGFGQNNVWVAGREGRIWEFNGNDWRQSIWFYKSNWDIGFQEIWGDNPSNIYAVGYADSANVRYAEMLNWNGKIWKEIKMPNFTTYAFIKMRRAANQQGNYFLLGWGTKSDGGDLLALFEFDGKNIWKIYENDFNSMNWSTMEKVGDKLYFMIGNKISSYKDGRFNTIVEINIPNYNQSFWGRNDKDIIIAMMDGIAHYDGIDIQYIYHFKGSERIFGAVILSNEIFILTNDFNTGSTIILRGKLP